MRPECFELVRGPLQFLVVSECDHGPCGGFPGTAQLLVQLDHSSESLFGPCLAESRISGQPTQQGDEFRELLTTLSEAGGCDGLSEPVERLSQLGIGGQVVGIAAQAFPQAAGCDRIVFESSGPGGSSEPGPRVLVCGCGHLGIPIEELLRVADVSQHQAEHCPGFGLFGSGFEDIFEQSDGQGRLVSDLCESSEADGGEWIVGDGCSSQFEILVSLDPRIPFAGLERQRFDDPILVAEQEQVHIGVFVVSHDTHQHIFSRTSSTFGRQQRDESTSSVVVFGMQFDGFSEVHFGVPQPIQASGEHITG